VLIRPLSVMVKDPYESSLSPKQTGSLLIFFQFSEMKFVVNSINLTSILFTITNGQVKLGMFVKKYHFCYWN